VSCDHHENLIDSGLDGLEENDWERLELAVVVDRLPCVASDFGAGGAVSF